MTIDANAIASSALTQIALVQGSITTVGNMDVAGPVVLQTIYNAVQNALAPFDSAIASYEADIDQTTVGGVAVGIAPPQMATALLRQTNDVVQEAVLITARAYLARVGANVANAPG